MNDSDKALDETAREFCETTIRSFERKADHNKGEAIWCFRLVIGCSLLAPLFVTLGEGILIGKLTPSLLSVAAAFSMAWLQQRKPQQLWALYRGKQRELEYHLKAHQFGLGEYKQREGSDELLACCVARIAQDAHSEWLSVVPKVDDVEHMSAPGFKVAG